MKIFKPVWCKGCKKFRQLKPDYCESCIILLKVELHQIPEVVKKPERKKQIENFKTKRIRAKKEQAPVNRVSFSSPRQGKKAVLLDEEQELISVLADTDFCTRFGHYWLDPVSEKLGWAKEKTRTVSRRLRRKGQALPPYSINESLIKILQKQQSSVSVYELAMQTEFCPGYIQQNLQRLIAEGKVAVCKPVNRNLPDLYFYSDRQYENSNHQQHYQQQQNWQYRS